MEKNQKQFTLTSIVPRNGFLNGSNDTRAGKKTGIKINLKPPEEAQGEFQKLINSGSLKPGSGLSQKNLHKLVHLLSNGN
jgi:hypothetical protein